MTEHTSTWHCSFVVRHTAILLLILSVVPLAGCGGSNSDAPTALDDTNPSAQVDSDNEDVSDQLFEDLNPIEVPEGTAEELFAFMEQVELDVLGAPDSESNAPLSEAEQAKALLRVMNARMTACDKILARDDTADTARTKALRIRLDALRTLAALDPKNRTAAFDEFADKLVAGNDPLVRRIAKATKFQSRVNRLISQADIQPDEVLTELKVLLKEEEAGPEILGAARDAASWIFQAGDVETATTAYRLIGNQFRDHSDSLLAEEGRNLLTQAINLELTKHIRQIVDDEPGAMASLMAKLDELLQRENDDPTVLEFSMQTAQFLEFSGRTGDARKAYEKILGRFEDDQLRADLVKKSVRLANRRIDLVGAEFQVTGVLLDGRPFDWEKRRGQWVLVAFWTTWLNDSWITEVENIRASAAKHAPELEVVLVNLDDSRNDVERFLQKHPSPWPVVVSADPRTPGFENQNAVRCGVEAVPFAMLIDPQSKVVDIHLMGPRLAEALQSRIPTRSASTER